MKLKEIMIFLLIFSFVMNGLVALRITQQSYGNEELGVDYAQTRLIAYVSGTIIAGIASAVAVGLISYRAGVAGDRAFAYTLLGGLLTTTLIGGTNTVTNIYRTLPANAVMGYGIVVSIFLAVVVVLISFMYIEYILGVQPE